MYEHHPVFAQPESETVKVWRYMDFTKLVSLVDTRCLFFSRADKLGDPFEGSWPRMNVNARLLIPDEVPPQQREAIAKLMSDMSGKSKQWLTYVAINCWHMNDHESAAMWKLYLQSNEGIAVQSIYKKLRDSIIDDERTYLGVVKYIDYDNQWIADWNLLSPFVHKRKSFEHEREARVLVLKPPIKPEDVDLGREMITHGLKIKVDIERLIERIYVAPSSPTWFADLVRAVIHKYGYGFEIVHSKLDEQPVY